MIALLAGLIAVIAYWLFLKPLDLTRLGYSGDLGGLDLGRQILADSIQKTGLPSFIHSDRILSPTGTHVTFMSWALERDWLGALFWRANPDFPWLYVYFGISLVVSYLGAVLILRKMALPRGLAVTLATLVTLLHFPRHLKTYWHYEHLIQHWMLLSVLWDAYLWKKWRETGRWLLSDELWRTLLGILCFGLVGYYWGPMLFLWGLVRGGVLVELLHGRFKNKPVPFKWVSDFRESRVPFALILAVFPIFGIWFYALAHAALHSGLLMQNNWWAAKFPQIWAPLWLYWFPAVQNWAGAPRLGIRFLDNETNLAIGWTYWIPLLIALFSPDRRKLKPWPFVCFLVFLILYAVIGWPFFFQNFFQSFVPFLRFFRAVSRTGLFLPAAVMALLALSWERWWLAIQTRRWLKIAFVACLLAEASVLALPPVLSPPMPANARIFLEKIKAELSAVLNFPFCVTGGNGICTTEFCPFDPHSVLPSYLTGWHDKNVPGAYLGRLTPDQCDVYRKAPYTELFAAWRENRCFRPEEWKAVCQNLKDRQDLAAVLVFPGIWKAAAAPGCQRELTEHLGAPIDSTEVPLESGRSLKAPATTAILRYAPHCRL